MKKMMIFEPALCCETGVCGVGVDPELLRISTVLNALKKNNIQIERFNLNSAPMEFIQNEVINKHLNEKGVEGLPAVMLDGELVITGRYPTNEELISLLSVPRHYLSISQDEEENKESEEGCCDSGNECCCGGNGCC